MHVMDVEINASARVRDDTDYLQQNDGYPETNKGEKAAFDTTMMPASLVEGDPNNAMELLHSNASNSAVLFRILEFIQDPIKLKDLEKNIYEIPEYASATQPPFTLITWLADCDALSIIDVDDHGNPVTADVYPELSDDERDDLVVDRIVVITEVGKDAYEAFNPVRRIQNAFDVNPSQVDVFITTLAFLTEKRDFSEIDRFLRGRDELALALSTKGEHVQPSSIVGKLSQTGAIVFNGGWIITPEGEEMLKEHRCH